MATFLRSPFLPHPITRRTQFSSSQTPPPQPPTPPSQTQSPPPSQQLSKTLSEPLSVLVKGQQQNPGNPATSMVESTDWRASILTRRFGLGGGLAWAVFLGIGVLSEQGKTSLEISQQEANRREVKKQEELVLPNGIRYYDLRAGVGASPRPGDLVVIDLKGHVEGSREVFVDTFADNKQLALVIGSRPYTWGMCEGIEYALRSMKAGGKRRLLIPPSLGYGQQGADLDSGVRIPPNVRLEYTVEVDDKVYVAPA